MIRILFIMFIFLGLVMCVFIGLRLMGYGDKPAIQEFIIPCQESNISDVTMREIEGVFGNKQQHSSELKQNIMNEETEQLWNSLYRGQCVRWQGVVTELKDRTYMRLVLYVGGVGGIILFVIWLGAALFVFS